MRQIQPELSDELLEHFGHPQKVGSAEPFPVQTFRELVEHTAKLAFRNKDTITFFRGQKEDYKNRNGNSSFYPSIYRGHLPNRELKNRFDILDGTSQALIEIFEDEKIEDFRDLKRRKSVQWSILQHYEVCSTPYLDFTHSLRVACSFARKDNNGNHAYIFIFGLPYLTNRITINSEHDIINVRLLSICPPTALRPYFQEGYLAGTFDVTDNYDSKTELDFNNRLIAKFIIPNNDSFWGKEFNEIPIGSLYPKNDPIAALCQKIKNRVDKGLKSGDLGEFLKSWTELEEIILREARKKSSKILSSREAIRVLSESLFLNESLSHQIDMLRKFRNVVVHTPKEVSSGRIKDYLHLLDSIVKELKYIRKS